MVQANGTYGGAPSQCLFNEIRIMVNVFFYECIMNYSPKFTIFFYGWQATFSSYSVNLCLGS